MGLQRLQGCWLKLDVILLDVFEANSNHYKELYMMVDLTHDQRVEHESQQH